VNPSIVVDSKSVTVVVRLATSAGSLDVGNKRMTATNPSDKIRPLEAVTLTMMHPVEPVNPTSDMQKSACVSGSLKSSIDPDNVIVTFTYFTSGSSNGGNGAFSSFCIVVVVVVDIGAELQSLAVAVNTLFLKVQQQSCPLSMTLIWPFVMPLENLFKQMP
jgi:hypothetical protein